MFLLDKLTVVITVSGKLTVVVTVFRLGKLTVSGELFGRKRIKYGRR